MWQPWTDYWWFCWYVCNAILSAPRLTFLHLFLLSTTFGRQLGSWIADIVRAIIQKRKHGCAHSLHTNLHHEWFGIFESLARIMSSWTWWESDGCSPASCLLPDTHQKLQYQVNQRCMRPAAYVCIYNSWLYTKLSELQTCSNTADLTPTLQKWPSFWSITVVPNIGRGLPSVSTTTRNTKITVLLAFAEFPVQFHELFNSSKSLVMHCAKIQNT